MTAWSHLRKSRMQEQEKLWKNQYDSITKAMETLKNENSTLFEIANQHSYGKRFPLEMRVPTEYPPRQIWFYEYFPEKK